MALEDEQDLVWRRRSFKGPTRQAKLDWAYPLRGVGRVPLHAGNRLAVIAYSDATRTHDWSCLAPDGALLWRMDIPAGGYASSLYDPARDVLLGPSGYNGFAELDAATGTVRWSLRFPGAVRSSPALHDGGYVAAIGNRLVRFAYGRTLDERIQPGHLFFGATTLTSDRAYASATVAGERPHNALLAFDPDRLELAWETAVGPDYLISCDTSGLTVSEDHGLVLVNAADSSVLALDADTGETRWRTALPRIELPVTNWRSRPAVLASVVMVGTVEGDLYALRAEDGDLIWGSHLDDLGIWSPALLKDGAAFVHVGLHLYEVDPANGSVRCATPIGFGSYSSPVSMFDRIAICGGDPPLDGYLAVIDPRSQLDSPPELVSRYQWGDRTDGLELRLSFSSEVHDLRIDLRPFGRSGEERLVPNTSGTWTWTGAVDPVKRLGETALYCSGVIDGTRRSFAICVDAGSGEPPSSPSARTLEDHELPDQQRDVVSSGPSVIAALARSYGRELDQHAIAEAGQYMVNEHRTPPAHKWRGGAGRIAMASRFPLRESKGDAPSRDEIERLLDQWELSE